jgi:hypothetical protein
MDQISLTTLPRTSHLEPLLEKEVQVRAYELYEQRGMGQGFALRDWLHAEAAEVLDRAFSSPCPAVARLKTECEPTTQNASWRS